MYINKNIILAIKIIISFLLITLTGCVYYSHKFVSEHFPVKNINDKYSNILFLYTYSNFYENKGRYYMVSLLTNVLKNDSLTLAEFSNDFIVDSIWLNDIKNDYFQIIFPCETLYSFEEHFIHLSFKRKIRDEDKLIYETITIPDSISTLYFTIPYYSIINAKKIYDTVRLNMDKTTIKYRSIDY